MYRLCYLYSIINPSMIFHILLMVRRTIRRTSSLRPIFRGPTNGRNNHAEILTCRNLAMSRVTLASADVKFRRSGHGSRPCRTIRFKWYSMLPYIKPKKHFSSTRVLRKSKWSLPLNKHGHKKLRTSQCITMTFHILW